MLKEFHWVVLSFSGFADFNCFEWVQKGCIGMHKCWKVFVDFVGAIGCYRFLLGFTGFYWAYLAFAGINRFTLIHSQQLPARR